ncbi:hypothetical protein [Niveibacterium terrae]|uniref:hypothetical protein n=1 Tax=Niveibacterium terrae TaxID=3373598 RepID=UPI003A8DCD1A
MKNILVVLVILAAAGYLWKQNHQKVQAPEVLANPVYAEARVKMNVQGRDIEGVMLGKTVDQADCQKNIETLTRQIEEQSPKVCPTCKVNVTSECKADLAPRYAILFDNQPTHVAYISFAKGDPSEREYRLIYWGVTVPESERLCSGLSVFQRGRKGPVSCVHAREQ